MTFPRRLALASAIAAATLLAACDRQSTPTASSAVDISRAAEAISQPAWLRSHLPDHTVAYARLPSPWGLASAPNGRGLDAALASEAHAKIVKDLRDAIRKDKLLADSGIAPALIFFFDDLAGPVEMAVVDTSDIVNPASSILVALPLRLREVKDLNDRVTALGGAALLKAPFNDEGKAELTGGGFLRFDKASGRLFALYGMTANALALENLVKQTEQPRPAHAMAATEQATDASGQGLFVWMSLKGVTGMAASQLPKDLADGIVKDALDRSQSVSMGWGTSGQRGRLQLQVQAPEARLLSYFAPTEFKAAVKTVGTPSWAATVSLPTAAQLTALEANLDKDFGAGSADAFKKSMAEMKAKLGLDLKDILGVLSTEMVGFEDKAGLYSAVRTTDKAALYKLIEQLGTRFGWKHETLKTGGLTVHHLSIAGMDLSQFGKPADATASDATASGGGSDDAAAAAAISQDPATPGPADTWLKLYSRFGTHLYWVEEGDYLVFGEVPQALVDRHAGKPDRDLGDWLRQNQSVDPATTLFSLTGTTHHAQRKIYYAYLRGLQTFGDAVGHPVDLSPLPNAAALQLPAEGAIGISLDMTKDRLGLSMVYEQNPAEVLFAGGGSMATVAALGIMSAIAIPAYQDYTVRAQVSSVLAETAMVKLTIAEYYQDNNALPSGDAEIGGFTLDTADKYLSSYYIDEGAIVLEFGDQANKSVAGQALVLRPYLLDGQIVWQCGDGAIADTAEPLSSSEAVTTVLAKHLPGSCK
ncbi:pilin [Tahibacter amnicola]|uniref:Pilin n=1 Tax=Tahibacter amnicola TaxID=2976241 RepID=A0ABY6BBC3_9GAMM|nr:pilin [Tahibacter amnicola]UXI67353.1 pilin [Tahibacter amnicola]